MVFNKGDTTNLQNGAYDISEYVMNVLSNLVISENGAKIFDIKLNVITSDSLS